MPASERILFVRPDAYGDLVLFEPVLRRLRHARPDFALAVLVRAAYQDVASLWPDGVTVIPSLLDPYSTPPPPHDSDATRALSASMADFQPTLLVSTARSKSWLDVFVASLLAPTPVVSLGPLKTGLIESAYLLERGFTTPPPEHVVQITDVPELPDWAANQRVLGHWGIGGDAVRPELQVASVFRERLQAWLAQHAPDLERGFFISAVGSGAGGRQWPDSRFADFLAGLEQRTGRRAVLAGHVAEATRMETLRLLAAARGASPLVWTGESGRIAELAALASAAEFYAGTDTGVMHIAGGVGKPVVAVYGGGHWPRFLPAAPRSRSVVIPMACFGCGWNCQFGDYRCIADIPAEGAIAAALELVNDPNGPAERQVQLSSERCAGAPPLERVSLSGHDLAGVREALRASVRNADRVSSLEAEVDRRLNELASLYEQIDEGRNERNLLQSQLDELRRHFEGVEADRAERGRVIEEQGARMSHLEGELDRWLKRVAQLQEEREEAINARNLALAERDDCRSRFAAAEEGRAARGKVIEEQGTRVVELEKLVDVWLRRASELQTQIEEATRRKG